MTKTGTIQKPIFTSAKDVEAAFYDALARSDLEAMMAVWSEDEEVLCIHPGGPRVQGLAAVRESWRELFAGGPRLDVRVSQGIIQNFMMVAVHSVLEFVTLEGDDQLGPPMIATNVYSRGPDGWRMVVHHASPAPEERNLMIQDAPRTVH